MQIYCSSEQKELLLLRKWHKGVIRLGGTSPRKNIGRRVRWEFRGTGTVIVHPVASWIFPPTKRSQSPLVIYSSTGPVERMLETPGFTPLLVHLESMTAKPTAVGGSKTCVAWKVEKAAHYFVHTDKITTDASTDQGREPPLVSKLPHMRRGTPLIQTSPQFFERFLAPGNPERQRGRMPVLHIQYVGEYDVINIPNYCGDYRSPLTITQCQHVSFIE